MSASLDDKKAVVAAAMGIAAESGWPSVTLAGVAARAEKSLAELHALCPDRPHLLALLMDVADAGMLAGLPPQDSLAGARDRLFEVVMARFDALEPYKPGLKRTLPALSFDPAAGLLLACRSPRSVTWMLEAAGIDPNGLAGAARIAAVSALWAGVLRTWLDDDSPDLARTMKSLDQALTRLEELANTVDRFTPGRRKRPGETAGDAPSSPDPIADPVAGSPDAAPL